MKQIQMSLWMVAISTFLFTVLLYQWYHLSKYHIIQPDFKTLSSIDQRFERKLKQGEFMNKNSVTLIYVIFVVVSNKDFCKIVFSKISYRVYTGYGRMSDSKISVKLQETYSEKTHRLWETRRFVEEIWSKRNTIFCR